MGSRPYVGHDLHARGVTCPEKRSQAQIMVPVLPFPPLQCTAITLRGLWSIQALAAEQKASMVARRGGSWSLNGKQATPFGKRSFP